MKCRVCILLFLSILPYPVFSQVGCNTISEEQFELKELIPDCRVVVNAPVAGCIDRSLPTKIIFYALPNGNTIEQTLGRKPNPESLAADEWKYDIQHIAAQTRFIREKDKRANYIVVCLESTFKAWTTHAARHLDSPALYRSLVDTLCHIIALRYENRAPIEKQEVILSSHSGGGRFIFNYISGGEAIPDYVKRIVFLDSTYGYEKDLHAAKLYDWLQRSKKNALVVYSYIDTTVRLNGKPIVSSTGGTGYRSRMMADDLISKGMKLHYSSDTTFCRYQLKDRVQILIKENPEGKIYHTVLVERNGFVGSVFFGTKYENNDYRFWGERCYINCIFGYKNTR